MVNDNTAKGAFVTIDEDKLGKEGWKLVGGIEALHGAMHVIGNIRNRSADVQERVFLQEILDLLHQGVQTHQDHLGKLAVHAKAGTLHNIPEDAKAN